MMKRMKLFTPVLMALALLATTASAADLSPEIADRAQGCYRGSRAPALVVNHENIPIVTGSQKKLSMKQIQHLIVEAGASMKRPWSFEPQSNGQLLARLNVRGKHTIMLNLTYSTTQYSLQYKDSVNMHHAVCDGYAFIHPNYNQWVSQLKDAINQKLMQN